jgi:hypothetical protein
MEYSLPEKDTGRERFLPENPGGINTGEDGWTVFRFRHEEAGYLGGFVFSHKGKTIPQKVGIAL